MLLVVGKVILVAVLPEIMHSREIVTAVSVLLLISYRIHTIFSDQALDEKEKILFRVFLKNDSIGL